ncbi:MAG TPA: M14 family zinc carboxypeptidase [Hyphomonadaceae bacterium]|nr:M14 family zinc carboxypeptidase [Hyphomonadaceae bacterium]
MTVDVAFPSAGRHDCIIAPDGSVVVSVDHEPALVEGINPSPWFAFRIRSDHARAVNVTLDYTDYEHRYAPHVSEDGAHWTELAADRVTLNERKTRASLKLDVPKGVLWVAGQPISPSRDNIDWTRRMLSGKGFHEERYGSSLEGRPLVGFVGGGGMEAIVTLTRQHPPETSGQEAYRGFLDRLINRNDDKAIRFRAKHRIILAPMPNPDGVDGGHWRLNAGGVDLNRDWGTFSQPETKALSEWIKAQAGTRRVVSMMDFHSTDKTVIYAPPLTAPSPTIDFLPALEKTFKERLTEAPAWSYGHNANGGTSKGWALEQLKAPGITVELWDQIPDADARALGAAAADALIDYFTS